MAIDYSTLVMVATVKRRAALPTVQPRFSDANIAAYCDEEMRNILVPLIMSIVEEHFVTFTDYSVTPTSFTFSVPPQAIGAKLVDVTQLVSGTTQEVTMVQLAPSDLHRDYLAAARQGYILKANKIIVQPEPVTSFTLRAYYYRRPNVLVDVSKAAKIVSVNTGTGVVTCASIPSTWVVGTRLNCIDGQPTFEVLFENIAIVAKSGFDVTLPVANVASLVAGTYLTLTGESVVPSQIPVEGHSLITESAVIKIAESLGDTVMYKAAQASYAALRSAFLQAIAPRVDRAPKKAVSRGNNCWDY